MKTTNIHGIFASHIGNGINTGINAVRGWDRAKCARVWRAGAEIIGKDAAADLVDTLSYANKGCESRIEGIASLCECTIPQAWASAMLEAVQGHFTSYTVIEGSESSQTISDTRPAVPALRKLMAA